VYSYGINHDIPQLNMIFTNDRRRGGEEEEEEEEATKIA